ncbi:nitroreductase [Candidatus Woesearchaeota archaeon B3_Woes]|nr:MAG: nitroreductase [Candidatus Woesearchaeota archaeon B3_Woes]
MIEESIRHKRTTRLFKQDKIDYKLLEKFVDCARVSSSARNSQPLEYIIIDDKSVLEKIFPLIDFGGEISGDKKAKKGFEPTALIIIIVKTGSRESYKYDVGIAAQNIALVAYENNIGVCMMGAVEKEDIHNVLGVSSDYFVDLVISLGYAAEKPVLEETDSEPGYYRMDDVLHVQKRRLNKIIHRNKF